MRLKSSTKVFMQWKRDFRVDRNLLPRAANRENDSLQQHKQWSHATTRKGREMKPLERNRTTREKQKIQ